MAASAPAVGCCAIVLLVLVVAVMWRRVAARRSNSRTCGGLSRPDLTNGESPAPSTSERKTKVPTLHQTVPDTEMELSTGLHHHRSTVSETPRSDLRLPSMRIRLDLIYRQASYLRGYGRASLSCLRVMLQSLFSLSGASPRKWLPSPRQEEMLIAGVARRTAILLDTPAQCPEAASTEFRRTHADQKSRLKDRSLGVGFATGQNAESSNCAR